MAVQDLNPNEVDQKQSIFNFLATVVYEAETLGLSYEKIFNNAPYDKPRAVSPLPGSGPDIKPAVFPADPVEVVKEPEQFWKFSLERFQDMLIRRFEEDEESPVHHVRPCRDYL